MEHTEDSLMDFVETEFQEVEAAEEAGGISAIEAMRQKRELFMYEMAVRQHWEMQKQTQILVGIADLINAHLSKQ